MTVGVDGDETSPLTGRVFILGGPTEVRYFNDNSHIQDDSESVTAVLYQDDQKRIHWPDVY